MTVIIFFIVSLIVLVTILWIVAKRMDREASQAQQNLLAAGNPLYVVNAARMKYKEDDGYKTRLWPGGTCDLYIFNEYAALVKKHNFLINFKSAPFVFGPHVPDSMQAHKKILAEAKFNEIKKEYGFILKDDIAPRYRYDVTLSQLSQEHINELNKVQLWISLH